MGKHVNRSINGATIIFKLQGSPNTATKLPISPGVFPCIAIQAGIPKNVIPSGIPCATYSALKLKYLKKVFSERAGHSLPFFEELLFLRFIYCLIYLVMLYKGCQVLPVHFYK